MNKKNLIDAILQQLQQQLHTAEAALKMAADTATHKETVPENKYDTFGLEASYLAHGQQQRVADTQLAIQSFEQLLLRCTENHSTVGIGSFLTLENKVENQQYFFIASAAGGLKVFSQGKSITVLSAEAPLCIQLLGKQIDDDVQFREHSYFISDIE